MEQSPFLEDDICCNDQISGFQESED